MFRTSRSILFIGILVLEVLIRNEFKINIFLDLRVGKQMFTENDSFLGSAAHELGVMFQRKMCLIELRIIFPYPTEKRNQAQIRPILMFIFWVRFRLRIFLKNRIVGVLVLVGGTYE